MNVIVRKRLGATRVVAVALCGGLALSGCATVVQGTATMDPAAVVTPDSGNFGTKPREIGPPNAAMGAILEGRRMAATAPPIPDVAPALRYAGRLEAGSLKAGQASVRNILGSVADDALRAREVGFFVGAKSVKSSADVKDQEKSLGISAGVIRMPSPEAASAAVGSKLLARDADPDSPNKDPLTIPGAQGAVAYTQKYPASNEQRVAFLAHKQFVIALYGEFTVDQISKFFDLQSKGLDGFTPTPVNRFTTLPMDESGVGRLTLPPPGDDTARDGSEPAGVALLTQSDIVRSQKTFADGGVDTVGFGANVVYRTRDDAAAKQVADVFVAEAKESYTQIEPIQGARIPGATCMSFADRAGLKTKYSYCVLVTGRYVSELTGLQQSEVVQGTAASYLILKGQK